MLYEFQSKTVTPKQLKLYKKFLSVIFAEKLSIIKVFQPLEIILNAQKTNFFFKELFERFRQISRNFSQTRQEEA